jgi:hypothetical protein
MLVRISVSKYLIYIEKDGFLHNLATFPVDGETPKKTKISPKTAVAKKFFKNPKKLRPFWTVFGTNIIEGQ